MIICNDQQVLRRDSRGPETPELGCMRRDPRWFEGVPQEGGNEDVCFCEVGVKEFHGLFNR